MLWKKNITKRGFTLVETLLYVSIISALVLIMSIFLFLLLEAKTKAETVWEVNSEGARAMRIITQAIRSSQSLTVPTQGNSGSVLTLSVSDGTKNPIVVNSDSSNLQIKEGTGAIIPLTSSKVAVSALSFDNLSRGTSHGTVRIQFTLTHTNPSGRNEYSYTRTFYGSASLK